MKYGTLNGFVLLILFVMNLACQAQSQEIESTLQDDRNDLTVSDIILVESFFTDKPIVEPFIAAHPGKPNILLVAAMIVTDINRPYESCRLSSFYSIDQGNTWKETTHDFWGYDPWLIMDEGKTFMSWLGTEGNFRHAFPLQVFSSISNGYDWDSPPQYIKGYGYGHDGTKMTYRDGIRYLSTIRFTGGMDTELVVFKAEGSGEFEEIASIAGNGERLNFCEPAVVASGDVVIPYLSRNQGIKCKIWHSERNQLSEAYLISDNPKMGRGYARFAVDTSSNSKYFDRLYFTRAVAHGGSSTGVWLSTSDDSGKNWTQERRIDHFGNGKLSKASIPSVAINKEGEVAISWVDAQHSNDQKSYDLYVAISKDGGSSFQKPVRITSQSSNPRTSQNGDVANKFQPGGHYMGLTAGADACFYLAWSESSDQYFRLKTCRVCVES